MRMHLILLLGLLLSGCATKLDAVRDFADETKKVSVAFGPMLDGAVEQCRLQFFQRRVYSTDAPLARFDPEASLKLAAENCKPIEDENATAKRLSKALSDYAGQLSALAADGVPSTVDDNFDLLASKLGEFKDAPKEKLGAIASFLKFVTRSVIAKAQREAIVEALDHEDAIGALADALVTYSDRVYSAYLADRLRDQAIFVDELRRETSTPISTRLRIIDVHQQTKILLEKQKSTANFRATVAQMKVSLRDLRLNVDKLSDKERLAEVRKLAKEVKDLYEQLAKAF